MEGLLDCPAPPILVPMFPPSSLKLNQRLAIRDRPVGGSVHRVLRVQNDPCTDNGFTNVPHRAPPQTSTPRGLMFVAPSGDEEAIANLMVEFGPLVPSLLRLTPTDVEQSCGLFPTSLVAGGVYEKGARDIDVDALLSSFASTARVNGVTVMTSAPVTAIERSSGGWTVVTSDFQYTADVVVNAAGAWGIESLQWPEWHRSV